MLFCWWLIQNTEEENLNIDYAQLKQRAQYRPN